MRIVILNSFYSPDDVGGAEKSVRFIAEELITAGHHVMVICTGRDAVSETINGVQIERIPVDNFYHPLNAKNQMALSKLMWHAKDSYNIASRERVSKILERYKPDLLHTNTLSGMSVSVWDAAKRLGIPVIHTLRDYYLLCPNAAMFSKGRQCVSRCLKCRALSIPKKNASALVDMVIGNSRFILDKHLEHGYFGRARKRVIYNAYEPKWTAHSRAERDAVVFGFIGRVAPTKGVDVLLAAFRAAFDSNKAIKLLIAGEPESPAYLHELQKRAEGLPVKFLGHVKAEDFYSSVHWTVMPSLWHEPLARVLFESFAHGVPLIASRTGGTMELIRDGENGYSYEATDVAHLSSLLITATNLGDEEYGVMKGICVENAKYFLPSSVISNYISAYAEVGGGCMTSVRSK